LAIDRPLSRWQARLNTSALRIILHRAQVRKETDHILNGLDLADRLITVARRNHFLPVVVETLLIRAQLHSEVGDETAGLADVTAALAVAEPEGVIALFLEGGPAIASMLARLLREGQLGTVQPDYVQRILGAFPDKVRYEVMTAAEAPAANKALPEPLTERELAILRLIEAGYSNGQIAERLVVTLHTVKKHNSNIYSKLGVRSRTQAVAKGRELKLL
jgi:LuxR family maltose regulon positive regulatory protein